MPQKKTTEKLVIANPPKSQICEIAILKTLYATLQATQSCLKEEHAIECAQN